MPSTELPTPHSAFRIPHLVAVLLVCATFPLIWVGGLVTTYDAGMAVPDWPGTYGYNLFLYPWQTWVYGPFDLFIEHGHRLFGAVVGMITIALVVVSWRYDTRAWARWLSVAALALVIFQGVLGGMRVIENEVLLARIHGVVGPAFFGLCVALAVVTSRLWCQKDQPRTHKAAGKLHRVALLTTALVFLQLIVGAHLRHLPIDWPPSAFRAMVFFHLILAAVLLVHGIMLAVRVIARHRQTRALLVPALTLVALIIAQVGLGAGTWVANYSFPHWSAEFGLGVGHTIEAGSYGQALVVTAHQATGSLILGIGVMLSLRSFRLLRSPGVGHAPSVKLTGVLA